MNAPSAPALIASLRRAERRFDAEPVALTGLGDLAPIPSAQEFIAQVDEASGTHWLGSFLVRHGPPIFTPEEEAAIEAQYAKEIAEELEAREREDRDEELRERQDSERARYGRMSGE